MSSSLTYTRAQLDRFLAQCRLRRLTRSITDRFDRCCHGGLVRYRLTLGERLYAANRFIEAVR